MKEKEIFILGAGFSRAIADDSMPLLHELTKEISEGITSGADNDIKNIWDQYIVQPNIGNIQSIDEQDPDKNRSNFEDIMTFLSSDFAYEDYKDQHLKAILYRYITDLIVKIFERKNQEKSILQAPWLHNFAKYLHNERAEIFTFNYDTVLENLIARENKLDLEECEIIYSIKNIDNLSFREKTLLATDFRYEASTNTLIMHDPSTRKSKQNWHIKLYKLHGSINWLYDPDFQNGVRIVSSHTLPEYRQGLQCLIVPPTMLKNFELKTKLLNFQWHVFKEKLAQAKKLYIIGYSIPKTDIATRYIIQTQLNPECEVFIISQNPTIDTEEGWYELFSSQHKNEKLHILKNGFNEDSIKAVKLD